MELILGDAALLAVAFFAIRWAAARPARFLVLAAAVGAATALIFVWLRYELHDSRFLTALAAFSGTAGATTAISSFTLRQGARQSFVYGALAAALVPPLYMVYIPASLTICWLGGEGCYV